MDRYLMKIHKINQRILDVSDYENLHSGIVKYLNGESGDHSRFVLPIHRALRRFRDPRLLSFIYRILGRLNINVSTCPASAAIPESLISTHFKSRAARRSMLGYLAKNSITFLDQKIVSKLLMDPFYTSPELCHFIEKYPCKAAEFMAQTDTQCFFKQLFIIEHCNIAFDVNRFLEALGSPSKVKVSRTYEAFTQMFVRKSRMLAKEYQTTDSSSLIFSRDLLLDASNKLDITSPVAFISFAFNFIKGRDLINKACRERDLGCLNQLLLSYTDAQLSATEIDQIELCWCKVIPLPDEQFTTENDFDFLFGHSRSKTACDCMEM